MDMDDYKDSLEDSYMQTAYDIYAVNKTRPILKPGSNIYVCEGMPTSSYQYGINTAFLDQVTYLNRNKAVIRTHNETKPTNAFRPTPVIQTCHIPLNLSDSITVLPQICNSKYSITLENGLPVLETWESANARDTLTELLGWLRVMCDTFTILKAGNDREVASNFWVRWTTITETSYRSMFSDNFLYKNMCGAVADNIKEETMTAVHSHIHEVVTQYWLAALGISDTETASRVQHVYETPLITSSSVLKYLKEGIPDEKKTEQNIDDIATKSQRSLYILENIARFVSQFNPVIVGRVSSAHSVPITQQSVMEVQSIALDFT